MKAIKWVLCAAALLAAGCAPTKSNVTTAPPVTPPAQSPEDTLRQRVASLQDANGDLAAQAAHLPGADDAEHRKLVVAGFADLDRILPLLYGPTSSEQFAEQMRVIDTSRAQIASASLDLNADPTIDTGLRAVGRSLSDINHIAFNDDADVAPTLQQLRGRLDELDNVSGPEHRVVVGNVFASIVQITQQLTGNLALHVTPEPTAAPTITSTPASAPVPVPAPVPASQPAAASAPAATQS